MPISPWLIADNGVRNPKRLKDGLRVLVNSEFHGNFSRENEAGMVQLLADEGVISIQTNTDNTIARKWRLNLIRLGFIDPHTHIVTENGRRLIHSSSLPSEEECFLRSLIAHQLPSSIHSFTSEDIKPFSPLRMVLEIIKGLEQRGEDPQITKNELASIVVLRYDMDRIYEIINEIIYYRNERSNSDNKKRFENNFRDNVSQEHGNISSQSLKDYADVNIRYLKLTGLFAEDGRNLTVAVHKEIMVNQIVQQPYTPIPDDVYETVLAQGAPLPTDDEHEAIIAINNLHSLLISHGEVVAPLQNLQSLSVQDLSQLRLQLENDWIHVLEKRYADQQMEQWQDILEYLNALQNHRNSRKIPNGEAPAYLEWAVWRAFLAMNALKNQPWEARRFKVDRSFLPVRHAPGGGPDMIFEFENFVIIMEVTLTSSSRQEAAEGEPVRRHVAQYIDKFEENNKRVYGIFIANNIDTNTAETFRIGVWYRTDDSELTLQIIPITLSDFSKLFKAIFEKERADQAQHIIMQLMNNLLSFSNSRAPIWKRIINEEITKEIDLLS
ncbi:AlwI family type II restriction endonuclease [Halobacillus ihumii]|uniref:AlwI family type II restriction endonuclease n=1 Tax=Halobacillus ihumii TaxID=2686092 RepID=UPI0013D6F4E2|nr:AlwI family type II restriction endonuclease [Halobacillus ihumii]